MVGLYEYGHIYRVKVPQDRYRNETSGVKAKSNVLAARALEKNRSLVTLIAPDVGPGEVNIHGHVD